MKRGVFIALFVIILMLAVSCNRVPGGENPRDTGAILTKVATGTHGIKINVLPNYPPTTIYDQNELIAVVDIENRGNVDIEPQDCFVQIVGQDPNIIQGSFNVPQRCTGDNTVLEGKNVYNTEGGISQIEFEAQNIQLEEGVFEYEPTLRFMACYNYETQASPLVCVDPKRYAVTRDQQPCTPKDVSLGGGQGAPVAVTYVGVDMIGKERAVFDITIKNKGGGTILSPTTGIQNCGGGTLARTDIDRVFYDVRLGPNSPVSCSPNSREVQLRNGGGKVRCTFNVPGGVAYETPLKINLQYSYIDSLTKKIRIVKTPE
jgi:hypothetical protein